MRKLKTTLLVLTVSCAAWAGELKLKHSETNQNLCIEFVLGREAALPSSSSIDYCFLGAGTNAEPVRLFFPRKEYFCRVRLLDEKGDKVAPTAAGEIFGSRFEEAGDFAYEKVEKLPAKGSNPEGPKVARVFAGGCASETFPAPEQLFQIKERGHYKMRLEFQVFKQRKQGTNYTYDLVRFAPVDIPVVKR